MINAACIFIAAHSRRRHQNVESKRFLVLFLFLSFKERANLPVARIETCFKCSFLPKWRPAASFYSQLDTQLLGHACNHLFSVLRDRQRKKYEEDWPQKMLHFYSLIAFFASLSFIHKPNQTKTLDKSIPCQTEWCHLAHIKPSSRSTTTVSVMLISHNGETGR